MTGGLYDWGYVLIVIPPVIQMSVNFSFFNLHFSADITPDMLKLCRVTELKVLFPVLVYALNLFHISWHPDSVQQLYASSQISFFFFWWSSFHKNGALVVWL